MDLPPELLDGILKNLHILDVEMCYRADPRFRVLTTRYILPKLKFKYWAQSGTIAKLIDACGKDEPNKTLLHFLNLKEPIERIPSNQLCKALNLDHRNPICQYLCRHLVKRWSYPLRGGRSLHPYLFRLLSDRMEVLNYYGFHELRERITLLMKKYRKGIPMDIYEDSYTIWKALCHA